MKNILIVSPKPFLSTEIKKYLDKNYTHHTFAFDSFPIICEANFEALGLERREDGYYLNNEKTDIFSDYELKYNLQSATQYAIAKNKFVKNCYNENIDLVLFVGSDFRCDILACAEYCHQNNIAIEKAYHSKQITFTAEELEYMFELDNIKPLLEIIEATTF